MFGAGCSHSSREHLCRFPQFQHIAKISSPPLHVAHCPARLLSTSISRRLHTRQVVLGSFMGSPPVGAARSPAAPDRLFLRGSLDVIAPRPCRPHLVLVLRSRCYRSRRAGYSYPSSRFPSLKLCKTGSWALSLEQPFTIIRPHGPLSPSSRMASRPAARPCAWAACLLLLAFCAYLRWWIAARVVTR